MALFGGLCNYLMNSFVPPSVVSLIEREIDYVPLPLVQNLIKSISPPEVTKGPNVYQNLFNAILYQHESKSRFQLSAKPQDINAGIITKAQKLNLNLAIRLQRLLNTSQIRETIRTALDKKGIEQILIDPLDTGIKPIVESRNDFYGAPSKVRSNFNFQAVKSSTQKYQNMNVNKVVENKISENSKNLLSKPQCLCPNQRLIVDKDDNSFECIHCKKFFHTICMKRKPNSEFCVYCHIERMMPLKRVKKTIYLGIFRRNFRKHIATFFAPLLEPNQKFQIRCLRLKEGAPTSCLFPDITEITINGHHIKDLQPINRQSCLKYRKDEPFNLLKGDYYPNQENILILNQNSISIKEKEVRYDPENHLFGVFVTEDIKINDLIEEIKQENLMGYSESSSLLKERLGNFQKDEDEITCQLVKIPLSCPLSTLRIDIPARGIFCTHFQCFDLKNYLTLISESTNPRWNCPLCKSYAYELQVDPILQEILKTIKDNEKIQEILFFKNGDYTAIIDDEPDPNRKNIKNLKIAEKKRKLSNPQIFEEEKPSKKLFLIPDNAEVIQLDD